MKRTILITLYFSLFSFACFAQENKYVKLSEDLLLEIKDNKDYSNTIFSIANINPDTLVANLNNDNLRKAFWINMYNAIAQLSLSNEYQSIDELSPFLYKKTWIVAQRYICLHEISNNILRHRRFSNNYYKRYQLDTTDAQVPFALNFGAKDCPPIYIFSPGNLNGYLYRLVNNYVTSNCKWKGGSSKVLFSTSLLSMYYHHLGGYHGISLLMVRYGAMPDGEDYDMLSTKPFNSSVERGKFAID